MTVSSPKVCIKVPFSAIFVSMCCSVTITFVVSGDRLPMSCSTVIWASAGIPYDSENCISRMLDAEGTVVSSLAWQSLKAITFPAPRTDLIPKPGDLSGSSHPLNFFNPSCQGLSQSSRQDRGKLLVKTCGKTATWLLLGFMRGKENENG